MRLVRFLAPKKLVDDGTRYALGLVHNQFSVATIYNALKSFATRVVGTKAVCEASYQLSPTRLHQLAIAIFIKAFSERYTVQKVTTELTNEINELRNSPGFSIVNMWKRLIHRKTFQEPSDLDCLII